MTLSQVSEKGSMMGDVGIAMAHEDDPEHESRQKADSTLESRDNVWCVMVRGGSSSCRVSAVSG